VAFTALASVVFYGLDQPQFLWVLLFSVIVNYAFGSAIIRAKPKAKRGWLWAGIAFNLGFLGVFKYSGFVLENLNHAFGLGLAPVSLALPIGISFYTFTQIIYLVDEARHSDKQQYNPFSYLLFVTFFPHLVAGPILRHNSVIPQFARSTFARPGAYRYYLAIIFFGIGLFKKVIIADTLAPGVQALYANAAALSTAEAWMAALLYTLQLYYDFSGYSEMAVGLAFALGVRIPFNFASPYKATSVSDFWRRWHRSLSWFLREYLYIPMGGNRRGKARQMANLFITMLLGGLWHGAGWTFILWGALHGALLVIYHLWKQLDIALPRGLAWLFTFIAVMAAWVVFRAQHVGDALAIWRSMLGQGAGGGASFTHLPDHANYLWLVAALLLWQLAGPNTQQFAITRRPSSWKMLVAMAAFIFALTHIGKISEFLYFQF